MTKIVIAGKNDNIQCAGYDAQKDIIYYDKRLNKRFYSRMKKIVLQHEMKHALNRDDILYHICLDIKDIFLPLRYDFICYLLQRDVKPKNDYKLMMGVYGIFDFFRGIAQMIILFISIIIHLPRLIFKGIKK